MVSYVSAFSASPAQLCHSMPGSGGLYALCNGSASVDVITSDPIAGSFTIARFPDLIQKRGFLAAAATNGTFMFAGGTDNGCISDACVCVCASVVRVCWQAVDANSDFVRALT